VTRLCRGAAFAAGILLAACDGSGPPATDVLERAEAPRFAGGASCVDCHAREAELWRGSHHDRAMQIADESSVLGDFDDAELTYNGVTSTFSRRDGRFFVRTDATDGALAELEIVYTFGVEPLQQYLVALPGGRYQALGIAWDSRPESAGGARWFHLYPDDAVDAEHPLHWTGRAQNWNSRCADCHSTGLDKGYTAATDSFATTWIDIDVNCESCHGPGSRHVASPADVSMALGPVPRTWAFPDSSGIAARVPLQATDDEIETCAQCHARRSRLRESFRPAADEFLDAFRPELLEPGLYHADGQIRGEVYEYGSFLQSAMHASQVTCSDCHDPHSGELRAAGNELCAQCHAPARFDTPEHHRHAVAAASSQCVACHMPATTYMVVDSRLDHSLRVPRPDLTDELGVPNACNACHDDRTPAWAAEQVAAWYPDGRHTAPHYAEAIAAGRNWAADRHVRLREMVSDPAVPGIVRATGIELLAIQLDDAALAVITKELDSPEMLVQLASLEALGNAPPAIAADAAQRFLSDPSRARRLAAARALIPTRALLSERRRNDLDRALDEYRAVQTFHMDRAEGFFNWGAALAVLGRNDGAERSFRAAIERDPYFTPAYVNLADLLRREDGEAEAQALLESALLLTPEVASLHFSLGLSHVRSGRIGTAVAALTRAVELAPEVPQYAYTLGVALRSTSAPERGLEVLRETNERFPGHAETLVALATMLRDEGRIDDAMSYARKLVAASGGDATALALLSELEAPR
jgi:predicted CXXCH cytochrome family protein